MILTNRLFERIPPSREAKSIFIFCEGAKREFDYFEYFKQLDSRINVEVYKLHPHENNSPIGLLNIAEKCIIKSKKNPNPKYNFIKGDEVHIILDTDKDKGDTRKHQFELVKEKCNERENWFLSLSNPCFEVWLYYHFHTEKPIINNAEKCSVWKKFVNKSILGGFDSRKHPLFIETASYNAKQNYESVNDFPEIGSTQVFVLANSIIPLIKEKLNKVLKHIERL